MRRGEGDLGVVGWGDFTLITMNRTKKALRTISVSLSSIYVLCSVSSLLVLVRCKWHKAGRFKLKARPVGEKMSDISLSFFLQMGPSFLSSPLIFPLSFFFLFLFQFKNISYLRQRTNVSVFICGKVKGYSQHLCT